jgi:ABC-type multidrug transport system ATPase subunit
MAKLRVISGPNPGQVIEVAGAGALFGYRAEKLRAAAANRAAHGLPESGELRLIEYQDPGHNLSGLHAWVGFNRRGELVVRDLGSRNHVYVGPGDEPVREARLGHGDKVRLCRGGAVTFTVELTQEQVCGATISDPKPCPAPADARVVKMTGKVLCIGRAPDNDLVLDFPQVSRHHCRIERRGDGTHILDLNSTNGTFINGHRVKEARLAVGDRINLGSYAFCFEQDRHFSQASLSQRASLVCHDIRKAVKDRVIIQGISFVSCPSEFTGLIGTSGSGKTTLLNVITGYDNTATGQVLLGGVDLYANYDALRGNVGYVPQDDIIHRALTVEQSLYYTARLRLPEDTTRDEVRARVDRVIADLGLEGCRKVRIGDPVKRGISGGQRKRVNLAQELITEPACLFLDEPLSGLDPSTAVEVTEVLADAARSGRSVILTTHNVESPRTFDVLGLVLLIHAGRLVYYGPAQEVFDYFGFGRDYPPNVLSHLQGKYCPKCDRAFTKSAGPVRECPGCHADLYHEPEYWEEKFRASAWYAKYVAGRMEVRSVSTGVGRRVKRQRANGLRQWWILVQRYWKMKLADTAGTAVLLAQAPVIALLIGLVFGNKGYQYMGGVLFMMALAAIWFGATNSCREIVSELSVWRRERMVNLKIAPYILSKAFVLSLFLLVQCLVLSGIVKLMVGELPGSVLGHTVILTLGGIAGSAMGLLISALLSSTEGAMGLVPVTLIPQVLFAGMVVPLPQLGPMKFLAGFMVSRWVLDALSHFSDKTTGQVIAALAATDKGRAIFYWFDEMPTLGITLDVAILLVLAATFTVLTGIALKAKDIV